MRPRGALNNCKTNTHITCLAFSPAGSASQVLAIGDEEGLVRLLDWQELLWGVGG